MTNIKESIIGVLKNFEQRDYKKGGVSIAPEMYDTIADKIYNLILEESVVFHHDYKYDKTLLISFGTKVQEFLLKPPFNLEHSQHGIACEKLSEVRESFLEQRYPF